MNQTVRCNGSATQFPLKKIYKFCRRRTFNFGVGSLLESNVSVVRVDDKRANRGEIGMVSVAIRSSKDGRNVTIVEWSGCCGQLIGLPSEKPPPVVFA